MSRHHWRYFGCQCSSARCRRLLLDRLTLFGIRSAEIIVERLSTTEERSVVLISCPLPIELRPSLLAVDLQRSLVPHRIRPLEDPVLPGGEAAENFRLHGFG